MALNKYKLGELIKPCDVRNYDDTYTIDDVKGISTGKEFIDTKANMDGISLSSYKVVDSQEFAYVADTSRRGEKIAIAFNNSRQAILISSIYTVFQVSKKDILLDDYLYMYFNRSEFDRYSRFNSWGSAREMFSWEDMCDIDIELPNIDTQQKYVDIYKSMVANQQSYEHGLEDLRLTLEGYIDNLKKQTTLQYIGDYLELVETKNEHLQYSIDNVMGISIEKKFIPTRADMMNVNLKSYYVVKPNEFAYVTVTSRNGEKISIALNNSNNTYICSSSYIVFKSRDKSKLLPQYLMLYFTRSEFNRYSRFCSWGSARETFEWNEMCNVKIPIPDIEIQKSIANIYNVYVTRKRINEQLKAQIKEICPILIRGSLEDGGKE